MLPLRQTTRGISDAAVKPGRFAIISPESGKVLNWIDLDGLLPPEDRRSGGAVLNGIAYDAVHKRLFVTGKLWPTLFEIRLVPQKSRP